MSCRHHLYLDVRANGTVRVNHEGDPMDMTRSCALDVAEDGEHTLEQVGELIGCDKARVLRLEESGMERLRRLLRGWR